MIWKLNQYFLQRNQKNLIDPRKLLLLKCRHLRGLWIELLIITYHRPSSDRHYPEESNKWCCIDYTCWTVPFLNSLQSFLFSDEYPCLKKNLEFQSLSLTTLKKEQASHKQSSRQMPMRISCSFWVTPGASLEISDLLPGRIRLIFCLWLLILSLNGRRY